VAEAQAHRHTTKAFNCHHTRHGAQLVQHSRSDRFDEREVHIVALRLEELKIQRMTHDVASEAAQHEDRDGERDPHRGERSFERLAFKLAENHARDLREEALQPGAFHQRRLIICRRLGAHCFSGRQTHRPPQRAQHTQQRSARSDEHGEEHDAEVELKVQFGKAEVACIDMGQAAPQPRADAGSESRADNDHQEHKFEVMSADLATRVAKSLEHGDLLALRLNEQADDDMEQKRGD